MRNTACSLGVQEIQWNEYFCTTTVLHCGSIVVNLLWARSFIETFNQNRVWMAFWALRVESAHSLAWQCYHKSSSSWKKHHGINWNLELPFVATGLDHLILHCPLSISARRRRSESENKIGGYVTRDAPSFPAIRALGTKPTTESWHFSNKDNSIVHLSHYFLSLSWWIFWS